MCFVIDGIILLGLLFEYFQQNMLMIWYDDDYFASMNLPKLLCNRFNMINNFNPSLKTKVNCLNYVQETHSLIFATSLTALFRPWALPEKCNTFCCKCKWEKLSFGCLYQCQNSWLILSKYIAHTSGTGIEKLKCSQPTLYLFDKIAVFAAPWRCRLHAVHALHPLTTGLVK